MLPLVFAMLKASAAVKAIVGTNPPRIYRHGMAPQDVSMPAVGPRRPYITWLLVSGVPENNLSDLPPCDRMTVQVDCWHPDDKGVETLASAVRDALETAGHVTGVPVDQQDVESRLYRMSLQADLFTGR